MLAHGMVLAALALVGTCAREEGGVNRVLHTGEPTEVRPQTPEERFLESVRQGDVAAVRAHLESGVDPRARDSMGSTALVLAARWTASVELLALLHGHAPELLEVADSTGRTPLSWAAERGGLPVLGFLLARGADPGTRDTVGRTPLTYAVVNGHLEAARLLLLRGAPVDAADLFGDTALMLAADLGSADMVRLLLAAGADRSLRNQEGRTALDRARTEEVRRLLLGKG